VTTLLFAAAAAVVLGAALVAVLSRDLVRVVLALGAALAGTAALYGMLDAPYMAAIQLLLYVGGVVTVLVFGVLLTHRTGGGGEGVPVERGRAVTAALAALAVAVPIALAVLATPAQPPGAAEATAAVGARFVTEHLLAFETLSAVLLAAMVGAIVLGRRNEAPGRKERS
jgi:NADH:ubiquinone oxidoreductase subunit 6 (subunit J)